jgi:hypothetical protein
VLQVKANSSPVGTAEELSGNGRANLVEFIGVAVVGAKTEPSSLDGCPMFAPAYMGRKRRAQPHPTLLP